MATPGPIAPADPSSRTTEFGDDDCLLERLADFSDPVTGGGATLDGVCVVTDTAALNPRHVRQVELLCRACSLLVSVSQPHIWRRATLRYDDARACPHYGDALADQLDARFAKAGGEEADA